MADIRRTVLCLIAAACSAAAVDGIAVSRQYRVPWTSGGDIIRYDIRNNDVVGHRLLLNGNGGGTTESKGQSPVINVRGTHVAFYRMTSSGSNYVSLVDIDGTGLRDLVQLPSGAGYDANGCIDWPRGDWVYYQQAEGPQTGGSYLRRVNVADGRDELVCDFGYGLWEWAISTNAARMHVRLVEADNPPYVRGCYELPGTCSLTAANRAGDGAGCGVGISPSGNWLINLSGGSHNWLGIASWANTLAGKGADVGLTSEKINSWCVNKVGLATTCTWADEQFEASVGYGMNRNRYSRNSDKWVCLCMGWLEDPGSSGRYGWCGMNQALLNWQDSIVVNVSRNPRACNPNEWKDYDAGCEANAGPQQWAVNCAGDFWCSTVEDVIPELREYATATVPGRPGGIKEPGSLRAKLVTNPRRIPGSATIVDMRGRRLGSMAIAELARRTSPHGVFVVFPGQTR